MVQAGQLESCCLYSLATYFKQNRICVGGAREYRRVKASVHGPELACL